jgi:hypothetical protein
MKHVIKFPSPTDTKASLEAFINKVNTSNSIEGFLMPVGLEKANERGLGDKYFYT